MKKPEAINTMGFKLDIFFNTEEHQKHLGTWSYEKQGIIINERLPDIVQKSVLLHELIHAASYLGGAFLKEKQIHTIAAQLFDTLRKNPDAAKWILSK